MAAKKYGKRKASGSNLTLFYAILVAVAILGIGAIAYAVIGRDQAATSPIELSGLNRNPQNLMETAQGVTQGNPDAPVKMILFSDYQCPHCREFALTIEPQLKSEFIDTGKLYFVFYDFPLGGGFKHSFLAARAARCAGDQDKFWEYHDLLFSRQEEWSYAPTSPTKDFSAYAKMLGLDQGEFDHCLNSQKYADVVTANRMLGEQLGLTGTPTVIVNNRTVEQWNDYAAVKAAIQEAMGS